MSAVATIHPETILHELAELWVSLAQQPGKGEEQPAGVLRACAMTLVAVIEETEDPANVGEAFAMLMRDHPSRAIVIRLRESSEPALSSRVYAQCWMPFGQRRQICCEQIEITASDASLADVPAVVLPLAVADLPVILWCRSGRLFRLPDFPALAAAAQKAILDSGSIPDTPRTLAELSASLEQGRAVADLAWTRLTRWRELIAQIFENRNYLTAFSHGAEIRIGHLGDAPTAESYYLGAWLSAAFEKVRVSGDARVSFERDRRGVQIQMGECRVSIHREEGASIEIRMNEMVSRTMFPEWTDYELLREELSIPGRDPAYESTLRRAAKLANNGGTE